jgi:hypothetical protein
MERKRLPSDTPLDALIEAAINESEELTSDAEVFASDVIAFLSHYKITTGNNRISIGLLYKLYKVWSKEKLKQTQFTNEVSLYIPRKNRYYLINKNPSELIADLASVIKKRKPPAVRKRANWEHFKAFLNAYEISAGGGWIEVHILYHFYDKWVYNKKKKKSISNLNILGFLKVLFEIKQTKDGFMTKINHNFDQSSIQNLRDAWKTKQKGRK